MVSLQFTAFEIDFDYGLNYDYSYGDPEYQYQICVSGEIEDHLTIEDGDGTVLMGRSCGSPDYEIVTYGELCSGQTCWPVLGSDLPTITSTSNIVKFIFVTDGGGWTASGWSVSWSAVSPGT